MTSDDLAAAYKEDRLSLDAALEKHLHNRGLGPVSDDDFLILQFVIYFANVGMVDKIVTLAGDRRLTVGQAIGEFNLQPFLEEQP